jgi:hypothetical protein
MDQFLVEVVVNSVFCGMARISLGPRFSQGAKERLRLIWRTPAHGAHRTAAKMPPCLPLPNTMCGASFAKRTASS